MKAPLPAKEAERVHAMHDFGVLDTVPELAFDDLTHLAAQICQTPTALVSLIDVDRQWFKSRWGFAVGETPRDLSFCAHAILQQNVMIVPDAMKDPRFADNALVTGAPHIRFYAGAPLITSAGAALGAVAVIDYVPRELSDAQQEALRVVSRQAVAQLELRRRLREHQTQAQAALLVSERRYRRLIESNIIGVVVAHTDGRITEANDMFLRMVGYTRAELEAGGLRCDALTPPKWRAVEAHILRELQTNGFCAPVEKEYLRKDGTPVPVQIAAALLDGAPGECLCLVEDLTERKRAAEEIRRSNERLQIVARATNDAVWDWDLGTHALWWNEGYQTLFGYLPEETDPGIDSWIKFIHPDDVDRVVHGIHAVIDRGGQAWSDEYRFRRRDGTYAEILDRGYIMHDAHGKATRMIGAMQDITARKQAEKARNASEERFQAIFEQAPLGIAEGDIATGSFVSMNERYADILGYTIDELWPLTFKDYTYPEDLAKDLAEFRKLATGEIRMYAMEKRYIRKDGAVIWVNLTVSALALPGKKPRTCMAVVEEITARKQAEAALRESEERFRLLTENIQEVFWMTEPEKNQLLYISPAYATIWGRTCASLYDHPENWIDTVHPADRERVLHATTTKQTRGDYDETYRITRPDGTVRWIHDKAYPVAAPNGTVFRIVGVAEDVTEYRALEEQLRRGQRVEAIGSLANGIAHDLNNILAPVLMAPALLKATVKSEHERQLLDLIEQSARRGSNVVRQLLTFSRGAGGERVAVQLRHLVKEMVGIMQETFPRDIEIDDHTTRDLRPVSGDPTQLHQVIMNLCVNARDAMPNGGKLTLSAKNVELSEADVQAHRPAKAGPHVAFVVADTGHGIAPETIERIFDPFFTTKAPGKGTGLGLAAVLGIVRSHEGLITVSSTPGKGATFTLYLPAARDEAGAVSAPQPENLPGGHDETILVVDDETAIRQATRLTLEKHRYRVLTASHGEEALEVFLANRDTVRLVLTDLMMPVMSGMNLIHALGAMAPHLKVIATSGLTDQDNYTELKAAGVTTILKKPCSPRELLEAIARELAAAK